MKNTMYKKKIKSCILRYMIVIIGVILLTLMTSCTIFDFGDKDQVLYVPSLNPNSPIRLEKVAFDYTNPTTGEWAVYYDETVNMAVNAEETFYIVIDYLNKSALSINNVVVTDSENGRVTYTSKEFADSSTPLQTRIPIAIKDTASKTITYKVEKIHFNYNSQVIAMKMDNVDIPELKINLNPKFKLVIDNQNGSGTVTVDMNYKDSLNKVLPAVTGNADDPDAPKKEGGWVFIGYYTKPKGLGEQVKSTDKYYFWKNVTLYAHYDRLFTFTVKSASEYGMAPIKDTYIDPITNIVTEKTYDRFAIITRKTNTGDLQTTLNLLDTIIDDSGRECAIVEIGDGAFSNTRLVNTVVIGKYVVRIGRNAFNGSRMDRVVFPDNGRLEIIDEKAFYGTVNLGKSSILPFTLPRTVKYLGDRCFESSAWAYMVPEGDTFARNTLTIYPNIEHIGDWCFVGSQFEGVEFAPGVKFRHDAVKGQKYVETINGQQVEAPSDYYLGWCLFKSSPNIKRFRTRASEGKSDGLQYVSPGMFDLLSANSDKDAGLVSVELAEGLVKIGRAAFYWQKKLKGITLPDTLQDICSENARFGPNETFGTSKEKSEYGAFESCETLSTVTFGLNSQLKVLGANAFRNNRALRSISFETKVFEQFGDAPFQGCDLLTEVYFKFDGSIPAPRPINDYKRGALSLRKEGADFFYPVMPFKVFVPGSAVDGFRVKLAEYASDESKKTMQVFATEMIKEIRDGDNRIIAKMALEKVTINQIEGWNMGYFFSTSANVIVPDKYEDFNIIKIGAYAFNRDVEVVTLSQYTMEIANYAFKDCTKLRHINFGNEYDPNGVNLQLGRNSLQKIGIQAFAYTSLKYFISGVNLKLIDNEAFYSCRSLEFVDLKLSQELTFINTGAFNGCRGLRYVRLPVNLNALSDAIFANNVSLVALVVMNPNVTNFFPSANSTYFTGVSSGAITTYCASEEARQAISKANYLPSQLAGKITYNSGNPSPAPADVLPGFYSDDIAYQNT